MFYYGLEWQSLDSYFQFKEITAPATPPSDEIRLYAKDRSGVSGLCYKNDGGVEVCLPTSGSIVTGTGTLNRLAKWTGTNTLGDFAPTAGSIIFAGVGGIGQEDNANFFWDDTNDRLGLGNATPTTSLDIRVTSTTDSPLYERFGISAGGFWTGVGARGTKAAPAQTQVDDLLGGLAGRGYDNQGTPAQTGNTATIGLKAGENYTSTARGSYITFETVPLLSTTRAERFRVGPSGQWGIGGATFGTAGQYFRSGGAAAAPTWATIAGSEVTGAALTKTDDTNVTLTLGGSPTTALLNATSLTLGWTGTLGVARGGTNIASYAVGDLLYASGTTTLSKLADVAVGSYLRSGGVTTAPLWSTLILPNAATANRIVYASATDTYGESANLAYDGTDFLLGSGIRARMSGQNRFRFLNSMARATNTTTQTITTGTTTVLTWDTNDIATDGIHSTSVNPTRFTAQIAGKYLIGGIANFDSSIIGSRYFGWRKNGSGTNFISGGWQCPAGTTPLPGGTALVSLAATDYIEFIVFQDSGGNLAVNNADTSGFMVYKGE